MDSPNLPPKSPEELAARLQLPCQQQLEPNAMLGRWSLAHPPSLVSKPPSDCVGCRWLGTRYLATILQRIELPDLQELSRAIRHLFWGQRAIHGWGGRGLLRPKMRPHVCMESTSPTSWPGESVQGQGWTPHPHGNPTTRTGGQLLGWPTLRDHTTACDLPQVFCPFCHLRRSLVPCSHRRAPPADLSVDLRSTGRALLGSILASLG